MANEAILRERSINYFPTDFTVADATGINKWALLKITDPRTAILSSAGASPDYLAGFAAREKVANDGITQLSVYQAGIFDCYLSGGCSAGQYVGALNTTTYPNYVSVVNSGAVISASGAQVLGIVLQNGVNGDQVQVRVQLA